MQRQILNWRTDAVIWEGDADTVKDALHSAIASGANLTSADLRRAELRDMNLIGVQLRDADLRYVDFTGANFTDADVKYADFRHSTFTGVNFMRTDLAGVDFTGANLMGATLRYAKHFRLLTGETWIEYLTETVPALLTAGGKSLESFTRAFSCHSWDNCPMAHAFDGHGRDLSAVPILLRPRAEQFIQLFDANQIPWPLPTREQLESDRQQTTGLSDFNGAIDVSWITWP